LLFNSDESGCYISDRFFYFTYFWLDKLNEHKMKTILITLFIIASMIVSCGRDKTIKKENSPEGLQLKDSLAFTSGYSNVNGIKMYYEAHGNTGEYLVLIHGGGSTIGTTFGKIMPFLAKNFKVIAVELQAHGHTSDRDSPESFEQDADDVATLLSNLNIKKASFFGFSNGGQTTMQIGVRHPEIVNKLIIASAFYKRNALPPGFCEGMKTATLKDMPEPLRNAFLEINPDSTGLFTMFNKDRERMEGFKDWKEELLHSIKAPSLIISGDKDIMSPAHALEMSKLIANSRLVILPATHGSYMGTAESQGDAWGPEMVARLIEDFLVK
jgi:pimeloyl-ACP methyl ester carboxylesterase